ncbi:OFA family MFS transporter [Methanospirillum sp. J.3.6.1-F.2.7.3]|uniref:OFA family MFS transporter n=2 Tax=Methanospirillum purgamenti TaxID=2834276 RepID=A0A8E7ELE5_9EURY|nr:OFA family MFS transporter [Methanospirillum sp. J.3.6.1-F.2.7.3]
MFWGRDAEKGRWILVFLGMAINLCLGSVYSWSVFVGPLTEYFTKTLGQAVTASEILMPFSVFLACFAIAMPLTGKYLDIYGPRKIIMAGGVLTGLGWILASFSTSVLMLYFLYGVIGGLGVGIAYGAPVAAAARWFPDRRGFAVGLVLLGFGFSAFITANLAGVLIGITGVMGTFRIFGLAFLILTLLLAIPFRFPPSGWTPKGFAGSPAAASCACSTALPEMVRSGRFYALWLCYFIGCLAGLMAISISKPVGSEVVGIEATLGIMLVGFFAIFNGGGRPVFGALTDMINPRNTAIVTFILIGGASLLLASVPSVPVYILAFALLWGCLGGWLAIAPASTARFFGTGDYPRCYGVIFLAYGAGAIAGPQIAGYIRDATGSYLGVFPVVAVLALFGIITAFFMKDT